MHRSKQHLYSITSSARERNVGGTVRPSALAVLRLITSSNFVGCSIGMSFGCLPCKILCTNLAPCRKEAGTSAPNDIRPPISANARAVETAGKRCLSAHIGHRFDRQAALDDERAGDVPTG